MKHHLFVLILLLALSFWSVRPLLTAGFFPMHDDTQVGRVIVMGNALREGQFPVRWVSDLGYGYGYPIFNFYGPLPYYVGGALSALGMDPLVATKTMFIIGIILSAMTMYLLLASTLGQWSGLLGSTLYLYAPYHAVQIYVRGAVGEFWAFGFFPLFLYGIAAALQKRQLTRAILAGGAGLAGVILSHTILGLVTTMFSIGIMAIFGIVQWLTKRSTKKQLTHCILLFVVGLGLSAFFWLPAYAEMGYTNIAAQIGASANFADHFVCPGQLWDSSWGFGGSIPGCVDGMSFKLGKVQLIGAGATLLWWLIQRKKADGLTQLLVVGCIITMVSLIFMLEISLPLWKILPMMEYVQYPWRFLAFTAAGLATIAAAGSQLIRNTKIRVALIVLTVTLTLLVNTKWFRPQYIYARGSQEFASIEDLRFRVSRISDEYLPPSFVRPTQVGQIVREVIPATTFVTVAAIRQKSTDEVYRVYAQIQNSIRVNKAFFPGWQYRIDDTVIHPRIVAGLPVFDLPQGEHLIEMKLTNTSVRVAGNIISTLTIIAVGIWYAKTKDPIT